MKQHGAIGQLSLQSSHPSPQNRLGFQLSFSGGPRRGPIAGLSKSTALACTACRRHIQFKVSCVTWCEACCKAFVCCKVTVATVV